MKTPASSSDATHLFEGYDLVNVFKFCALQDVLSFGTTSKRVIPDVAVELDRRRRRRMMCPTRWEHAPNGSGTRLIGVDGKEADWSAHTYRFFSLGQKCPTNADDVLPSVTDRLGVLLRSRPFVATHPLYNKVRELYDLLNEDTSGDDGVMAGENTENEGMMKEDEPSDDVPFENLLLKLRSASRAHRLHAEILINAIEPPLTDDEADFAYVKVTLERYIGDVLVASAFISHSVSGLVEGGPSEENWMDMTIKHSRHHNPYSWYKAWIFLHSTVLRTAPFLPEHAKLLGIESRKPVLGISSADDELGFPRAELVEDSLGLPPLIPPTPPFIGADKRTMMSRMSQLKDLPMKITKNTFGGLGPAFRGRDNVSSETIWPMRAISVITAFTGLAAAHYQSPTNPAALRWREGTEPGIR